MHHACPVGYSRIKLIYFGQHLDIHSAYEMENYGLVPKLPVPGNKLFGKKLQEKLIR